MNKFLLYEFKFSFRGQQPDPEAAHPNPPSNSPLPKDTSPPAGQGQAANAAAAPQQVPTPP
ncbi:hypothetical protein FPRO06_05824 [Fusarium proliferatum]|nr:hypothetical protein FPRO03_09596 [Fusarium proliferatum]KAG4280890.1 hypothetical protein FPRO04_05604 [Fusarium proliferatum]KAG4288172.1 hypothetical protein FPRO06_05824 [Fusarium proliferatum]CVL02375.1 uncharacterized protein FPRN_08072 [Fusarium proliferatum]